MTVRHAFPLRYFAPAVWLTAVTLLAGCNTGLPGNGISKTEDRVVEDFNSVSLRGIGDVTIRVGETQSVSVTVDENLIAMVETTVEDGEMVIQSSRSIAPQVHLRVDITMPALTAARVSGVGDMSIREITGDSVTLTVSGVGSLSATGDVGNADVRVSGVGSANLAGLHADHVVVRVSGTGDATVFARTSVDASVSGIGDIVVHGNPESVIQSASGIGDVTISQD